MFKSTILLNVHQQIRPEGNVMLFIMFSTDAVRKCCRNVNAEPVGKVFTDHLFRVISTKIPDLTVQHQPEEAAKQSFGHRQLSVGGERRRSLFINMRPNFTPPKAPGTLKLLSSSNAAVICAARED